MSTNATDPITDRIERALARIEAAAKRQAAAQQSLTTRHAALRQSIEKAIEALDVEIGRREPDEEAA